MNSELETRHIAARSERQATTLQRLLRSLLRRVETPLLLTEVLPPRLAPANDASQ